MNRDRSLRLLTIGIVVGAGAIGLARDHTILSGGVAWLGFLFFVLSGLGWLVVKALHLDDPDFGLRATWGAAAYITVAGVLVMLGICSRPLVLGMIGLGVAGFAWRELVSPVATWSRITDGIRALRAQPLLGYLAIVLGALALVHLLGAVVETQRNPWDDDVAYIPLLKRLLDIGDQIEPFSFRRLGAYGGQVALQALGGARGTLENPHLIDQGLCFGLCLLLIVGYARDVGRVSALWLALLVVALLVMPDISINTASYWSGAVLVLAIYRTLVRQPDSLGFALAAALGAAMCTLRQSYLPAVALFLVFALVFRTRHSSWARERRTWLITIGVAAACLLPWCIATYLSNRTFLFPFVQGTWNHGLSLAPSGWSWVDKLSFLVSCVIDAQPFVVLPIVFPLLACARDARPGRPLTALFLASTLGFFVLVASFTGSDSYSISRYAFGYLLPLLCVFVIDVASEGDDNLVDLVALGRWVLLAALLVQIAFARAGVVKRYKNVFVEVAEAMMVERTGDPNVAVERARYREMQAAIPAGARVAVMLDDAGYLDYRRNEIFNLDTPGYASPGSQLPMFVGAEAMRNYFLARGISHLAFVRGDHSRYMFRREFWLWRIFHDIELFQVMSAYIVNALDTFDELARTQRVVYERDGQVVVDLGTASGAPPALDPAGEADRREAWMARLAVSEGLEREWALTSRHDLIYLDGISDVTHHDGAEPRWFDVYTAAPEPKRGIPTRWLHRRAHLRVRGGGDMHLVIRGHVNPSSIYTRPRLDVSLDGELLASVVVDEHGDFVVDLGVPRAKVADWADLYLVFNTIGTPEREVRDLRVARIDSMTWERR